MKAALTRANSLASFAIRARVWQPWSHGLFIPAPGVAIDSTFKLAGVRRRPLDEALHGVTAIQHMDFQLDREAEARDWLHEQLGKRYDFHAIVGFAIGDERDWRDDTSWFCWELLAGAIEHGSAYRFENVSRVTPRDLIRAERALAGFEV
jgi:uncharacterized protein YycO